MELASNGRWRIRQAEQGDTGAIGRLLGTATLRHLHVDWHLPVDWLGGPEFVLCERNRAGGGLELVACLAVGADPPPAAWVRVAAVRGDAEVERYLEAMLRSTVTWLRDSGVTELGWLPEEFWPDRWLSGLGFRKANWIVTYRLDSVGPGLVESSAVTLRPATTADMPQLAAIEEAAFAPLWRHSSHSLLLAFRQAVSFEVAEIGGQIVGFQYSVAGQDGESAHLVRLTVTPEAQGQGVGSALMQTALSGYASMGARQVTLNTQLDNHASHRLYERFGFERLSGRTAVWAMTFD